MTGKIETNDLIDPWMTGEADSDFAYTLRPLVGAEYTITAAEDIYTQDRQLDANGSRTLWYAEGDVVAVVTTGDGSADTAVFAPSRTKATYDFLSVIHDGYARRGRYYPAAGQLPCGGNQAALRVCWHDGQLRRDFCLGIIS